MIEPYTNDSTYFRDAEIKFDSQYSFNGIHVTVYEPMCKEEREEFDKHLRRERDVVSILFVNKK